MANRLYKKAKQAFANKELDWDTDTFRAYLVDGATYTPNTDTDDFLDDIPSGELVAFGTLANKTNVNGVCDADDLTIPGVTGDTFEYVVIVQWTGSSATSRLICLFDTNSVGTPNGGSFTIQWNASGIFEI
jgi:hypothetical protein